MAVYSFDHANNKEINKKLIRSVQGVADDEFLDVALIKRMLGFDLIHVPLSFLYLGAARTYFKTRKNRQRKISSGKQTANAAECRQRQRRHNVSLIAYKSHVLVKF